MAAAADGAGRRVAGWSAVVVDSRDPLDDELAARIAADGLGAAESRRGDGGASFHVYFDDADGLDRRVELVERALRESAAPPGSWSVRTEHVADGRWVERYVAGLKPFLLGRRFVVDPAGDGAAGLAGGTRAARSVIRLIPGRAFGTGEHPTTRLCAVGLERFVRPGSRWLDIGCGTGILSLVASRCGAAEVLGVDIDDEAVSVAAEVLAANGAPSSVRVAVGGIESVRDRWDGVVVNIETGFVERHAGDLSALLADGGVLLVSGLLAGDRRAAERHLLDAGLTLRGAAQDDGWSLVIAGGRSGSAPR